MKNKNKSLLIKAFSIAGSDLGYTDKKKELKKLLSGREDLTSQEKNAIFKQFRIFLRQNGEKIDNSGFFIGKMYSLMYKIERKTDARTKEFKMKLAFERYRNEPFPVIFYLCSSHDGCTSTHKDYQGKIYVDHKWKKALERGTGTAHLIPACEAYIKNHGILSIQSVTEGYPYLITRPNCRHRLKALDTWTVLTSSLNKIKHMNQDMHDHERDRKSKGEYRKEYKRFSTHAKNLLERQRD